MIKEYLLTTDEFLKPKSITGSKAVGILLIRLLTMLPGTNPLHPKMGVGIGVKYRFLREEDLVLLQEKIESQISTYMPPEYQSATVDLTIEDGYLNIIMLINGTSFVYNTGDSETPVQISTNN